MQQTQYLTFYPPLNEYQIRALPDDIFAVNTKELVICRLENGLFYYRQNGKSEYVPYKNLSVRWVSSQGTWKNWVVSYKHETVEQIEKDWIHNMLFSKKSTGKKLKWIIKQNEKYN